MSDTYEIGYRCDNCYFKCIVLIPFGTMAEDGLDCPNCGCGWLCKASKYDVLEPRYTLVDGKLEAA